jgi:hypothetical protein
VKANKGETEWQRFFMLMGHSIAVREGQNPVPGVPFLRKDLLLEIRKLERKLNVIATLQGWTNAITYTSDKRRGHLYLLTLNFAERKMAVRQFAKTEAEVAADEYSRTEKRNINKADVQTVLVSVDSLDALRLAYPNYYMDTTAFVRLVEEDIEESAGWEAWPVAPHR